LLRNVDGLKGGLASLSRSFFLRSVRGLNGGLELLASLSRPFFLWRKRGVRLCEVERRLEQTQFARLSSRPL
jgi:hypothetical protein